MDDLIVTRDDLIKGDLCLDGVNEVIDRIWPIAAAMPVKAILPKLDEEERCQLLVAVGLDGYGHGDGDGYGHGYGYGYGDGRGYGYGDGRGYVDGYGRGYGYGDGYGEGEGDGDG